MDSSSKVLVVLLISTLGFASADKYVAVGGTGDGSSASNPLGSLQQAVNVALDGETIFALSGTYLIPTLQIFGRNHLTIRGNGSLSTFIQSPTSFIILLASSDSITIDGFTFQSSHDSAIHVTNGTKVVVSNCVFFENLGTLGGGILLDIGTSVVVESCVFRRNFGAAIYSDGNLVVSNSRFEDNVDYGVVGAGIRSLKGNITIQNSIFLRNLLAIYQSGPLLAITGSKFFNNSFYSGNPNTITCAGIQTVVNQDNLFCGPLGNAINCPSFVSNGSPLLYPSDACGVCNGDLSERDFCTGQCFTKPTTCPNKIRTIYVANGGTGNGLLMFNPAGTIQKALDFAVSGDIVVVFPGTYVGLGNTKLNFGGKGIKLRSQFSTPQDVIIDCGGSGTAFVINQGESVDTIIEGFTLRNCFTTIMISQGSTPTIKNSILSNNGGDKGGAVSISNGYARFSNVDFIHNFALSGGGAIYIERTVGNYGGILVDNCRFIDNNATSSQGGAIIAMDGTSVSITNSFFIKNSALNGPGGAISDGNGGLILVNNSFFTNSAPIAGSIICSSSTQLLTSQNSFCGTGNSISCLNYSAPITATVDICGVCGGSGKNVDCSGQCWGPYQNDGYGGCCVPSQRDCAGHCNTTTGVLNVLDIKGACCPKSAIDTCGICYGTNICCNPPCGEFGNCIITNTLAFCNCSNGYSGPTCNAFTCTRPCKNAGRCVAPDTCDCTATSFVGPTCSGVPCGASFCDNGGTCISGICNCSTAGGYTGPQCNVFNCTKPCNNGGICVGIDTCSCAATGFSGPTCDTPVCVLPCQNGGTCLGSNNCFCPNGQYVGPLCSTSTGYASDSGVVKRYLLLILLPILAAVVLVLIGIITISLVRRYKKKSDEGQVQLQTIHQQQIKE